MQFLNFACVVGARPNFMKMAPLLRALDSFDDVHATLIHTGQHYDPNLSDIFFQELEIKRPEVSLGIGSGKPGEQTARILEAMESVLESGPPGGGRFDRLIVVGDVTSTMASALAAVKLGIPVAHVEAGLRSFDRTMPEEINRIVTDSISDMFFVSEPDGIKNLVNEGQDPSRIHEVGNVMIDTLMRLIPRAQERNTVDRLGMLPGQYGVVTLHRPANVDHADCLAGLVDVLIDLSNEIPFVFPAHPRTLNRLESFGLMNRVNGAKGLRLEPPMGYLDFLSLTSQSRLIITDSGGLQEESTALGVPCLTMRPNTERPITVEVGTSTLIGSDAELLRTKVNEVFDGEYKTGFCPPTWDGNAAKRIGAVLTGQVTEFAMTPESAEAV